MKITKASPRPFDVDGTLIYPNSPGNEGMPKVTIYDPVEKRFVEMRYNPNMVRLLKEEHQRGSYIIVWSRGGWEWAKCAVLALSLEAYVHRVMDKPWVCFDDRPVEEWLVDRVYIAPNEVYKR